MAVKRSDRVAEEIQKLLAQTIQMGLKDPRVKPMTNVTRVEVTNDLSHATVYISTLGSEKETEETVVALDRAKGFLKSEIGSKMRLRIVPDLHFKSDLAVPNALHISSVIDKALEDDAKQRGDRQDE